MTTANSFISMMDNSDLDQYSFSWSLEMLRKSKFPVPVLMPSVQEFIFFLLCSQRIWQWSCKISCSGLMTKGLGVMLFNEQCDLGLSRSVHVTAAGQMWVKRSLTACSCFKIAVREDARPSFYPLKSQTDVFTLPFSPKMKQRLSDRHFWLFIPS